MANKESDAARERRWQAEEDAQTLARHNEIMSDKKRLSAATKIANKQANDLEKKAKAMKAVAKKGGK